MKAKLLPVFILSLIVSAGCSKSGPEPSTPVSQITVPIMGSTVAVTVISPNSIISGGTITSDGGAAISAKGICINTSPNPTILNNHSIDGTGTGNFSSSIYYLSLSTTYYIRAYATNSMGTAYGNEISFTTGSAIILPAVTTADVSSILSATAAGGGNIISDGGATVTMRGICWSTSPDPTIANSKTYDGTGLGVFTSNLTGLTENTIYNVRAYATNSAGTAYGSQISFKTAENGTVYIGGSNNTFYALNALTGQLKWKYTGSNWFSTTSPCFANGRIYTGSADNYLYCLDPSNGALLWRFAAGMGIESDPVYDNGTIYFGSIDDYLYAVDANTGVLKWRFLTGANVSTSPVVNNGVVYFGSDDKKMYALNAANGLKIWDYQCGGIFNASGPSLDNGFLYIGCRDGYLYAIAANTGQLAWRYSTNNISMEMSSPTVVNNVVYIGGHRNVSNLTQKGAVYAVNATTGQLVWEALPNTAFNSSPVFADGKLIITSESGDIIALDAATGGLKWFRTISSNVATPNAINGIVYVGGGGANYIYALDLNTGIDKWRFTTSGSPLLSGPCIVTSSAIKHAGESGMQN